MEDTKATDEIAETLLALGSFTRQGQQNAADIAAPQSPTSLGANADSMSGRGQQTPASCMQTPSQKADDRQQLKKAGSGTMKVSTSDTHAICLPPPRRATPVKETQRKGNASSQQQLPQQQPQNVHPVIRLGWKPLCEVHCNGLVGRFYGGHDRELFIRCTSSEYENLPLVDYTQGGCIMSCSQFEKMAGRELSKKWKESIHVVGEGEGSKATLVSWLKRQAEAHYGNGVVGQRVWVCWASESDYYRGIIVSYSRQNGKHKVQYNDRFVEELHLPVELISFAEEKPVLPVDADGSVEAPAHDLHDVHPVSPPNLPPVPRTLGRSVSMPGAWAGRKVSVPPSMLCHQGSGISVSSTYDDEFGVPGAKRVDRKFRGRARLEDGANKSKRDVDEEYKPPGLRSLTPSVPFKPPSRRRKGPWSDEGAVEGHEGDVEGEIESQGPAGKRPRSGVVSDGRAGRPPVGPSGALRDHNGELIHSISMPASFSFRKVHHNIITTPAIPIRPVPGPPGPLTGSLLGNSADDLSRDLSRDHSRTVETKLFSTLSDPAAIVAAGPSGGPSGGSAGPLGPVSAPAPHAPSFAPWVKPAAGHLPLTVNPLNLAPHDSTLNPTINLSNPLHPTLTNPLTATPNTAQNPTLNTTLNISQNTTQNVPQNTSQNTADVSGSLPGPPCSGFEETNVRTISRWMNCMALALDSDLMGTVQEAAEQNPCTSGDHLPPQLSATRPPGPPQGGPAGALLAPAVPGISVSGRFQTLLVYARKNNSIHGYYEAMLTRYEAFKQSPEVLRRKMSEFMVAALHEDSTQSARELLILARERKNPSQAELADQFGA